MPTTHPDPVTVHSAPGTGAGRASPLWATLIFTFAGSLGTGIVTTGIFFLAKHAYGFTDTQNYALGFLEGLTYIAGALGAGPLVRRLRECLGLSTRAILAIILLLLAAACLIPYAADLGGGLPKWSVWVLMALYSPVTGALWPIIESYLSGGRAAHDLRASLGRFNITWSSATFAGLWLIGPLVEHHATLTIIGVGALHVASLAVLPFMHAEPGRHIRDEHEPHPAVYRQLLITFRILLPTSYVVLMALNPFLPSILTRLGVAIAWQAPLGATWMAGRFVTFIALERWHGWHGRWYPALAGVGLLLSGFGLAVLSPLLGPGNAAVALVLVGLAGFGIGMAVIYAAALYYAMEVGQAQVEAGGKHEALIGLGYTGGPACGLLAGVAIQMGLLPTGSFEPAVLVLVGGVAVAAGGVAARRSWRAATAGGAAEHRARQSCK